MDNVSSQVSGSSSVLAADWNTYVRDNFDDIKAGHVVVADATARVALGAVAAGTMVFEASTNKLWVYTTAWFELGNFTQNTAVISGGGPYSPFFTPVGMVTPFASATAPTGWLLCDGSAKSTTTNPEYTALWGIIGTSFGGSGASSFNVPNLLGRTIVGAGSAGAQNGVSGSGALTGGTALTARALGAFFGDEALASHSHTMGNHTHTYSGSGTTNDDSPDHSHNTTVTWNANTNNTFGGSGNFVSGIVGASSYAFSSGGASARHKHTFSWSGTTSAPSTNTTETTGTGVQANFMPSVGLTYIIKY